MEDFFLGGAAEMFSLEGVTRAREGGRLELGLAWRMTDGMGEGWILVPAIELRDDHRENSANFRAVATS